MRTHARVGMHLQQYDRASSLEERALNPTSHHQDRPSETFKNVQLDNPSHRQLTVLIKLLELQNQRVNATILLIVASNPSQSETNREQSNRVTSTIARACGKAPVSSHTRHLWQDMQDIHTHVEGTHWRSSLSIRRLQVSGTDVHTGRGTG